MHFTPQGLLQKNNLMPFTGLFAPPVDIEFSLDPLVTSE
jgi:hypothetical protein